MAKLNQGQQLEKALAFYQTGKSFKECEKLTGVNYKKIEREARKRGIEKGSVSQLVSDMTRVREEFVSLPVSVQDIVSHEVDKRLLHMEFFNNAAVKNVEEAMSVNCANHQEFKFRAETILKGKEVVIGKSPDVSVDIHNTNAQANVAAKLSPNDVRIINDMLENEC